jgi:hypothetical protein
MGTFDLCFPKVGVIRHESLMVHVQVPNELPSSALIPISIFIYSTVELCERLKFKIGKLEPGCPYLLFLSYG